jgi:hypothetical protein
VIAVGARISILRRRRPKRRTSVGPRTDKQAAFRAAPPLLLDA